MAEVSSAGATINGWLVLYHPVFRNRYIALRDEVRLLKSKLSGQEFAKHPRVKLFAAVRHLVSERVPANPNAPEYRLRNELSKHRRAKGQGLPPRYRLYWVFSQTSRVIIFTYLNDDTSLRKEGAKSDPYEIYKKMVARGEIGQDFDQTYRLWQRVMGTAPVAPEGAPVRPRPARRDKTRKRP
jgi:toxin YhaV